MDDATFKEALNRIEIKLTTLEGKVDSLRTDLEERGEGAGCFSVLIACFCAALAAGGVLVLLLR